MKIYRVWASGADGCSLGWASSKREANKIAREFVEYGIASEETDCEISVVDFPRDRAGIIRWLNKF